MEEEGEGKKNEEKGVCDFLLNLMKNYNETTTTIKQDDNKEEEEEEEEEETPLSLAPSTSRIPTASSTLNAERQRRETMNQYFSILTSMLPSNLIPINATQSTVLDGTIEYVKQLERELEGLEEEKKKVVTAAAANGVQRTSVKMVVSSNMATFGVQCEVGKGLVTKILVIFEKHNAEVLTSSTTTSGKGVIELTVTAIVRDNVVCERIKSDIVGLY